MISSVTYDMIYITRLPKPNDIQKYRKQLHQKEEYIYYMYNTLYMFDTQHKLNWVQQVI